MYIVSEKDLKGVSSEEVKARMGIVHYLSDWSGEVFQGAKDRKTISLAGRYIRSRILEKGEPLTEMLEAVVLIDLMDFWRAVDGYNGKRDDVLLYGVFCILFGEVNDEIKEESKKLEGNVGFAPRLRFDISERTMSEVTDTNKGTKGKRGKKKVKPKKVVKKVIEEDEGKEDAEELEDEEVVEIKDKYVTPSNVNKLTVIAVGVIGLLVVSLVWLVLF